MITNWSLAAACATILIAGNAVALAAEQVITQKDKKFSTTEVTLKKGDALVFRNDDKVTHNVYSATKGNEFDVGDQKPGESSKVPFPNAGEYSVRCAVHPGMKLKVIVKD